MYSTVTAPLNRRTCPVAKERRNIGQYVRNNLEVSHYLTKNLNSGRGCIGGTGAALGCGGSTQRTTSPRREGRHRCHTGLPCGYPQRSRKPRPERPELFAVHALRREENKNVVIILFVGKSQICWGRSQSGRGRNFWEAGDLPPQVEAD